VLALVLLTWYPLAVAAIAAQLASPDGVILCATATVDEAAPPADGSAPEAPTKPAPVGHVHHHCPGCFFHTAAGKAFTTPPAPPAPSLRSTTVRLVSVEPASAAQPAPAAFYSPRGPPASSSLHAIAI
jgi:hypothetical protein